MIRVGFLVVAGGGWLGGVNYFRNLAQAICDLPDRKVTPVLFIEHNVSLDIKKEFANFEVVYTKLLSRWHPQWVLRKLCHRCRMRNRILESVLKENNISILSHTTFPENVSIPTIGWIPDFQHKHLPKFFSTREYEAREKDFNTLCRKSKTVILSSYDAKKDLETFLSEFGDKARVLNFVAHNPSILNEPSRSTLEEKYQFKGRYIYVPNQFWEHKNHRLIIEALNYLKYYNKKITVISSGRTHDYRNAGYFTNLMKDAEKYGVLDMFKILGVVPYADVVGLMRNSTAVLNPSLFEGWSTSVEEAKSMGKKVILSNINVHLEQNPSGAYYFDPHSANDLANILWDVWSSSSIESDVEAKLQATALEQLPERWNKFARDFQKIVLDTMNS